MTLKVGDRVRLREGARENIIWLRNKFRHGTVARVVANNPWALRDYLILWDGKMSLEQWEEEALEILPCQTR